MNLIQTTRECIQVKMEQLSWQKEKLNNKHGNSLYNSEENEITDF